MQCASEPPPLPAHVASLEQLRARTTNLADATVGAGQKRSCLCDLAPQDVLDVAQPRLGEGQAESPARGDGRVRSPVAVQVTGRNDYYDSEVKRRSADKRHGSLGSHPGDAEIRPRIAMTPS
jgi:hypothetical protein